MLVTNSDDVVMRRFANIAFKKAIFGVPKKLVHVDKATRHEYNAF